MPINVIITIPHPFDDVVNFALYLLSTETSSDDRFILHKETNDTPFQRHARNLIQGVSSRNNNIIAGMKWIRQETAKNCYVHFYNRFSLADLECSPSIERIENYLELCRLYFHDQKYSLTFIDFRNPRSNPRVFWCRSSLPNMTVNGVDQMAAGPRGRYGQEWSFSPEHLAQRAHAILGPNRLRMISFSGPDNYAAFLSMLFDQVCCGRPRSEVIRTDHELALSKLAKRLQRRVHEVGQALE
jgi:hypothetical protein